MDWGVLFTEFQNETFYVQINYMFWFPFLVYLTTFLQLNTLHTVEREDGCGHDIETNDQNKEKIHSV